MRNNKICIHSATLSRFRQLTESLTKIAAQERDNVITERIYQGVWYIPFH